MARVLIVDDEPMFHQLLSTVLEQYCGHDHHSVKNGAEALSLIASGAAFDLVVTDLRMPVMTGQQLIAALRRRGTKVPIILMTGDVSPPVIPGVKLLRKPFNIQDFIDAVAEALAPVTSN